MAINQADWEYERNRLNDVYEKIQDQLSKRREEIKYFKGEIIASRREMWENTSSSPQQFEEMVEAQQHIDQLKREWEKYQFAQKLVERLEKTSHTPYFARVDFKEEGEPAEEQIYIGALSFIDSDTREIYIYDWRAPIAGIFYDYETGPAAYQCLDGTIGGEISLKRQFRIFRNNIEYMFDSSIKIDDEILQQILSKSADDKMRNIVATIQREQNRVIRNEEDRVLIVQGAAGSGKTSIALHRAAYLLYRYRNDNMGAKSIVIFSPNSIFNDYISDVLPELGEENIGQTTFLDFARQYMGPAYRYEDSSTQMELLLDGGGRGNRDAARAGIDYKASESFLNLLNNYMRYIEDSYIRFGDINYKEKRIISREGIEELYKKDYRHLPVFKRLGRIRDRILFLLDPYEKQEIEEMQEELESSGDHKGEARAAGRLAVVKKFKVVRDAIEEMTGFDAFKLYVMLFQDRELFYRMARGTGLPEEIDAIRDATRWRLEKGNISYEDLAPLMFFRASLEGVQEKPDIKHVIVDEAQDYSLVQYEVFKQFFPHCSMTMLGDLNQSIYFDATAEHYEKIAGIFSGASPQIIKLSKSYRPTRELMEFSAALLAGGAAMEAVNRSGVKPKVVRAANERELTGKIIGGVSEMKEAGMNSIAVICKTAEESKRVYGHIGKRLQAKLITKDDEEFVKGTVVIPTYLAKGLEFDGVILYNACEKAYHRQNERKLLYVACTRALHRLNIYYEGSVSPFIGEMDQGLFTV